MTERRAHWGRDERWLLTAGLAGIALVVVIVCCGDDENKNTDAGKETRDGGSIDSDAAAKPDCDRPSSTDANTAAVVKAAEALLDALTSEQKTKIKYDKTLTNAAQWSNLPTTFVQRNGVRIGDMSSSARDKAVALAEAAAGETGGKMLDEVREADEFLVSDGKASSTDYGRGLYYFSIHGTPSTSSAWMLQIAGHHLGYNFMYGGKCASATPLFDGVEPTTWTADGKEHMPLEAQRATMVALLEAIGSKSDAKLSGTFSDLINGPTGGGPGGGAGGDTKYPSSLTYPSGTSGRGVRVSTLTNDQKQLVKKAIEAWVNNAADPVAAALLAQYESDAALADTYVGYTGSTDLTTQASYVRIDGPRVWIEVTIQGGIIYRDRVHYHTIWRDKVADYGAEFSAK
jgi:hypothetical protein